MVLAAGVDERREVVRLEVAAEPEGDQERESDLLGSRGLADPLRERPAAGGSEGEGDAVAHAGATRRDEPAVLQDAELPVDVAGGDVPEARQAALHRLEQIPAGHRAVVEEAEEGALGGVQVGHLTFPSGRWTVPIIFP